MKDYLSREQTWRREIEAAALDPLTSAVLSLEEIQTMVEEMFSANRDWLPRFRDS